MRPMHLEWPVIRWIRLFLEAGGGFALTAAFYYVVDAGQFASFAAAAVPVIATYIATAGLLYNRARALPKGPSKTRSLYSAERAVQATVFTLAGIVIGTSIFAVVQWFHLSSLASTQRGGALLFAYLLPMAFVLSGYISFVIGFRAIAKDFLHPLGARDIAERIRKAP